MGAGASILYQRESEGLLCEEVSCMFPAQSHSW